MNKNNRLKSQILVFFLSYLCSFVMPAWGQEHENADKGDDMEFEVQTQKPERKVPGSSGTQGTKPRTENTTRTPQASRKIVNVPPGVYKVVVQTSLNIRKQASSNAQKTGTLNNGDIVQVESCANGWAYIRDERGVGYINAAYLQSYSFVPVTRPIENDTLTWSEIPWRALVLFLVMLGAGIWALVARKTRSWKQAYIAAMVVGGLQLFHVLFSPAPVAMIFSGSMGVYGTLIAIISWVGASIAAILVYDSWWYHETFRVHPLGGCYVLAVVLAVLLVFVQVPLLVNMGVAVAASALYHKTVKVSHFLSNEKFITHATAMHLTACLGAALTPVVIVAYFIM